MYLTWELLCSSLPEARNGTMLALRVLGAWYLGPFLGADPFAVSQLVGHLGSHDVHVLLNLVIHDVLLERIAEEADDFRESLLASTDDAVRNPSLPSLCAQGALEWRRADLSLRGDRSVHALPLHVQTLDWDPLSWSIHQGVDFRVNVQLLILALGEVTS